MRIESSMKFNPRLLNQDQNHYDCRLQATKDLNEFLQEEAKKERVRIPCQTFALVAFSLSNCRYLSQQKATTSFYSSVAAIKLISKIVHVFHYRPAWQRSC